MWYEYECINWMPFGWIWMALFWIGIIVLSIWAVGKLTGRNNSQRGNYAFDIVEQRYARGEISKQEFEQIKKDL